MKRLTKIQTIIFAIGSILMVLGAGCYALLWGQKIVCWVYLVGTLMFATIQISQSYKGKNTTIQRLKKIMATSDIFFILSGILMVDSAYKLLMSFTGNFIVYYQYIYNKWVLLVLVAAVLELYSTHRISYELKKESNEAQEMPKDAQNTLNNIKKELK